MVLGKKNQPSTKVSEAISGFVRFMEAAKEDYHWNFEETNKLDRLTQDYLHKLELDGLDYRERAKVATQLMLCRQERREHKDMAENLAPIVELIESDKGKNLLNLLRETLGKTRKVEERMGNRVYIPRVLDETKGVP